MTASAKFEFTMTVTSCLFCYGKAINANTHLFQALRGMVRELTCTDCAPIYIQILNPAFATGVMNLISRSGLLAARFVLLKIVADEISPVNLTQNYIANWFP